THSLSQTAWYRRPGARRFATPLARRQRPSAPGRDLARLAEGHRAIRALVLLCTYAGFTANGLAYVLRGGDLGVVSGTIHAAGSGALRRALVPHTRRRAPLPGLRPDCMHGSTHRSGS